jgi:transglutaminase-like putative cysteine protease
LPILAFLFSSLLFGFAEEITEHVGVNKMQLAYAGSVLVILLIWTFGESKHKLAFRSAKRIKYRSNANEHSRRKRAVPISIFILAVLMLLNSLIPASAFYVKIFDDNMSRLFGQRYQEPSSIPYLQFSLKDLGYYPQENRLGGTPQLLDETYMYLNTDSRSIHLRGTAYFEYTGLGWTIDGMNPNWLMGHSRNASDQAQILGPLHKSDDVLVRQIMPDRSFELRPVHDQQVIFHGGRPDEFVSLDSGSFNVYFNQSGNLYLDKRISQDGYRGLGQWLAVRKLHDTETLESMIGLFPESQMSVQDRSRWLNLPQLPTLRPVLQELHPALGEMVYGSGYSDAERVTSIRSYLADNFVYKLNVETPPGDRDFVTYFLETGEGYCTYFATALTVLLRSAGIPARYVEGFLVPQSDTGATRELRGENGHAWTEVWFDGLGWVPIDATPSSTLDQMDNTGGEDPGEVTVPTEVRTEPTETIAPTEVIPKEEHTQEKEQPEEIEESSSFLQALISIVKLLFYILLFSSPIWLYILWRYRVYRQRHKPEYLHKRLAESSAGDLISKIDMDLQAMWRLEAKSRYHGETIRGFVGRMNLKGKSKIDQVYLDLTEKIYYDDPDGLLIAPEDLSAFLSFYEREEKRLKEDLPREKWIFKRFLWSDYHPLPR